MTTRNQQNANFDRIARPYRWMEYFSFGRSLERCRNNFLPQLAKCGSALVLGDGDGRFSVGLLATNPGLYVDAVDTSAIMLKLLQQRVDSSSEQARAQICTHHISALEFKPQRTYDLIVTHFFLDCLTQYEVNNLIRNLARRIRPGGLWLISEFRIPSGAMHRPARAVVRLLYLIFRLLTGLRTTALPDYTDALAGEGFSRIAHQLSLKGLLSSEIWEYTPAMLPPQKSRIAAVPDPLPDPEPASPSLPEPDPAVFHHEPVNIAPSSAVDTPRPSQQASEANTRDRR